MADEKNENSPENQLDEILKRAGAGTLGPKDQFEQTTKIGLLMAYDLIDKIRYWEKETMEMPEEVVVERLDHLVSSVEELRTAYLSFAEMGS